MNRQKAVLRAKGVAKRVLVRANVVNEHFVPHKGTELGAYIAAGNHVAVHHLIRYQWAAKVMADARGPVLDVACGSGFGTRMMSEARPDLRFVGADYDAKAISTASRLHPAPNVTYRQGDVTRWAETIGGEEFGCVVCFDTIEHVAHREVMLRNLVEHLAADGMLLVSTPVHGRTILRPDWEHHEIEYSTADLYDILRRYFAVVERPEDGLPHLDVFDQLDGTPISYRLEMNPVICREPIRHENPYAGSVAALSA